MQRVNIYEVFELKEMNAKKEAEKEKRVEEEKVNSFSDFISSSRAGIP